MSFTRTLRAVGGVVVAGALLFGAAPTASADQFRDMQWPLSPKSFKAEDIWKVSTGKDVTVAVIDDAINGSHPDLSGNVLPGKNFIAGGRGDQADGTSDHGTAMAAIIAAHGHGPGNADGVKGLAPDAKILPVAYPVVGDGVGHVGLGGAIRYAVDNGASVINMSIAPPFITDSAKEAVAYAVQKNVLIVAGAGNDGAGKLSALAAAPGVVAVGAVDKAGQVWDKSNWGSQLMLTAPGVSITSASASNADPYVQGNGTSDATAYVSAAAALLRSKFPDLTAGQIANRLVKTAGLPPSKAGLTLPDPHYGYGFIRPLRALTQDIPAGSKNGPLKMPQADPSATASGASSAGASGDQASGQKSSGIKPMLLVGVGVGVLVVIGIIVLVVVRQKKNGRNGPPPGGFGGPGGPGGPAGPGFPQQPANPYQQQPNGPGAFPPPPNQYPGQ
ncbi:S8 family serine peptidase [Streptomyces sp. NPDC039016]|uniref:S8 family serine peptidase n=1 Tax=Streptomyces sp. NPDC039016 TaxID=3154330 RepID=UPI0033C6C21D